MVGQGIFVRQDIEGHLAMGEEEKQNDLTTEKLIKKLKVNIAKKLVGGETPAADIERLLSLEKKLEKTGHVEATGEETGIPSRLRIKRKKYTLSDAALKQRKEAAQKSTGPTSEEGKKTSSRNNWKHGLYAQSFFSKHARPCKSTCPDYPCNLIEDGKAAPGADCLDKEIIYEAWNAILRAVENKDYDEFNALATLSTAKNIQILRMMQESILEENVIVKSEKLDRDGNKIGEEIKLHPSLLALPKLIEILGFTPKDLMMTPKELSKAGREEEEIKTVGDIMSNLMSNVGKAMKKEGD